MEHPFASLAGEYAHYLSIAKITRPGPVHAGVDEIMKVIASYEATGKLTNIPTAWIGPTDCRESDCNPHCGIGQGDRFDRVSRHVPAGKGPFSSKADADEYYLHYDKIDVLRGTPAWTLPYMCFDWEHWNGWGPRAHGRLSGYLWSCTSLYDPLRYGGHGLGGKYVADGKWSGETVDPQPGAVALYLELIQRRPDLAVGAVIVPSSPLPAASDARKSDDGESPPPIPPPIGVHDADALQAALNKLGADPALVEDGNYGRLTRRAVESFQAGAALTVDGLAGPQTWAAIDARLKGAG